MTKDELAAMEDYLAQRSAEEGVPVVFLDVGDEGDWLKAAGKMVQSRPDPDAVPGA